jgi:hypothetical protein
VKEVVIILAIALLGSVLIIKGVMYFDKPRVEAIRKIELNTGCEYLGRPRDLGNVSFFECRGVIEMRRTPQ